jgi:crossover junction endodeoxyribonuclease RuvC
MPLLRVYKPPEPVVIGIDASLTDTGLVCLDLHGDIFQQHAFKPKRTGVDRLVEIQEGIKLFLGICSAREIVHVCMEQYGFEGAHARHSYIGEGGGAIKLALLAQLGDPLGYPTLVGTGQLKIFVTNRGTSKKNEMLLGVYKKWGYETRDDNLADAYGLAQVARSLHLDVTTSQYERDVIEKLIPHTERALWTSEPSTPRKKRSTSSSRSKGTSASSG